MFARPQSSEVVKRKRPKGRTTKENFEREKLDLLREEVEAKKKYMEKIIENDNKKVDLLQQIVNKLK